MRHKSQSALIPIENDNLMALAGGAKADDPEVHDILVKFCP